MHTGHSKWLQGAFELQASAHTPSALYHAYSCQQLPVPGADDRDLKLKPQKLNPALASNHSSQMQMNRCACMFIFVFAHACIKRSPIPILPIPPRHKQTKTNKQTHTYTHMPTHIRRRS